MRLLVVVAALTVAVGAPAAGMPSPGGTGQVDDAAAGLLPQLLAGLLGLVAAALAMRQLARARRKPPPGRHLPWRRR
jgi:hypothetical protein